MGGTSESGVRTRAAVRMIMVSAVLLGSGLASVATAAPEKYTCAPVEVAVFTKKMKPRIHVECATPVPGTTIRYFALSTKSKADVAMIAELLRTALVDGRALGIWFDRDDLSGSKFGCQQSDCRLLYAAYIR